VCSKCEYHFPMTAAERVAALVDEGSFKETDPDMVSVDRLKFTGVSAYTDRLKSYQRQTGLNDAVLTGAGKLVGHDISLAAMDFAFLGASMGAVVGEKITRHGFPSSWSPRRAAHACTRGS
jgi:acetyl-CoA carboxylase carboxyl transferase subunit beta